MVNKPYPVNGDEQKVIYAKKYLCVFYNNTGLSKFVKRKMNKRYRRQGKAELKEYY